MRTKGIPRGIFTVDDIKERSIVDGATHCWLWQGATSTDGMPRIWTVDLARAEKRTMSGPLAAWMIAHGSAPLTGYLVFRRCLNKLCLNPAHLREAKSKREICDFIVRSGKRKGRTPQRVESVKRMWDAAGVVPTPKEIVLAIRADTTTTGVELARRYGMSSQSVSKIRLNQSHRHLEEA